MWALVYLKYDINKWEFVWNLVSFPLFLPSCGPDLPGSFDLYTHCYNKDLLFSARHSVRQDHFLTTVGYFTEPAPPGTFHEDCIDLSTTRSIVGQPRSKKNSL